MAYQWGLLSSYESWDDPPRHEDAGTSENVWPFFGVGSIFTQLEFKVVVNVTLKRLGDLLWSQVESPGPCFVLEYLVFFAREIQVGDINNPQSQQG